MALLEKYHKEFDDLLVRFPPTNESALAPVGYTGFRWATQLDPVWNAYLLALAISLGPNIEAARLETSKRIVYSYRFEPDQTATNLFSTAIGWREFQQRSLTLAKQKKHRFVLICDIADFYSRVYHHRLENALDQLGSKSDAPRRIIKILKQFSNTNSYGLPVGGPAARLLAELVLNRVDRLLVSEGITFCRYADDYHLFAPNLESAYQYLVFLTEKLLRNEGLTLQKSKTRILTSKEFITASEFNPDEPDQSSSTSEARRFLRIPLRFDPYAANATENYEALKNEVGQFDVLGLLSKELVKSRIHIALTRKLISAMRFLSPGIKGDAARTLVDNHQVLAPVFPQVLICIYSIFEELDQPVKEYVCATIRQLILGKSHIMSVNLNLCYALRVLSKQNSEENIQLLAQLFRTHPSALVRRDAILIMAGYKASYWISDLRTQFRTLGAWERRAFIVASFLLGDEGKHWRTHIKNELTPIEALFREWASQRFANQNWSVLL